MQSSSDPTPTERLGPYDVLGELGAGAMGVVYKAHDPRLDRSVALKALPEIFADDEERLSRFEREARMLAALHHPHVASLHGLEEHGGRLYLVMEFVEGETLGQRIARGTLDVHEILELAEQIARGLSAAHDAGIIHRDLKPGNVLVTPDGRAKVVDFGLAKDVTPRAAQQDPAADGSRSLPRPDEITRLSAAGRFDAAAEANSGDGTEADDATRLADSIDSIGPTVVAASGSSSGDPIATEPGAILGTAAYMSPEQARGRPLDRRTDVWSFGCVLYEMLTGQRPFRGANLTETIVAVLQKEPDWTLLPQETPPAVRRLLERCLRKDPQERLRDLGDAALEIRERRSGTSGGEYRPEDQSPVRLGFGTSAQRAVAVAMVAGVVLGLLVASALWVLRPADPSRSETALRVRAEIPLDHPLFLGDQRSLRLSPDGRFFAWTGFDPETADSLRIFLRPLDGFDVQPIEGTEGVNGLFFSPDGEWIAFFDPRQSRLLKVSTATGTGVRLLAEGVEAGSKGGTWLEDGSIVIGLGFAGGLALVREGERLLEQLTEPGPGVKTHRFPEALPGGRRVLFTESDVDVDSFEEARIRVLDLDSREVRTVLEAGSDASFVPADPANALDTADGWLVYSHAGSLMSVPLILDTLETVGAPTVVIPRVLSSSLTGFGLYSPTSASRDLMVYVEGGDGFEAARLIRLGRDGSREVLDAPPRAYRFVRVSKDERRLLLHIDSATGDEWIYDLERSVLSRLTSKWDNLMPAWTGDGRIAYSSNRQGVQGIYIQAADGGAAPELFLEGGANVESWTPDGRWLIATRVGARTNFDLVAVSSDGEEQVELVKTESVEYSGEVSLDGWLTYVSDETGQFEVYVRPFLRPGPRLQVSVDGGFDPAFGPAGDEILYRRGTEIFSIPFDPESATLGAGQVVFRDVHLPSGGPPERIWDVLSDGSLLYPEPIFDPAGVRSVRLVAGIRDELAATTSRP